MIRGWRKLAVLVMPWVFLAVFGGIIQVLLLPNAAAGHVVAVILTVFAGLVFVSFTAAALAVTRDVVRGRYPGTER